MTVSTTSIVRPSRPERPSLGRRIRRSPVAMLSIIWLAGLVVASFTAPLWLRYGPLDQDLTAVLQGPSAAHLIGTDEVGRDLLSRLVTAAAPTLLIALATPIVAVLVTVPVTLWAARYARAESVVNRVSEIVLSLPGTVIILAVIAAVGSNMPLVMAMFGLLLSGALYKVFFGQAKSLHHQLFVEASAIDGVRPMSSSIRHVLPNMSTTVIVQFVLLFGAAIGLQAGLAFIGLGPQPPEPTWGGMVQSASKYIFQQPWMMIPTGGVLALTIIAANALADILSGGAAAPPPLITLRRQRRTDAPAPAAVATSAEGELAVRDLVIGVAGGPALVTGVSLTVAAGTVMGIVGESGCGKSVTSYAMLGLLAPGLSVRSGAISWGGVDLASSDEKTLQKVRGHEIAFISQEPTRALDPMFTIEWQLVAAIRRLRGASRSEAKEIAAGLLGDVGILDIPRVLRSYPHQISGGMAQRVAISLAIAGRPRLIIADEPTTALDVTVQADILGLLRGLVAERGMSVIIVTHDLGVVADLCDEVSVMYAGQIVETGSVRDVLVRPEHPYTMALLAADPHTVEALSGATRLASIPGQVPAPAVWPSGCRFVDRCRFATPECAAPVALDVRREGAGSVRCIRRDQVAGRQNEWRIPAEAGGAR
ncbi:MAG: dipeptide/oligopeptide/nickel ABC transporter permease/ATP-binding protein [Microbacterium sp.]